MVFVAYLYILGLKKKGIEQPLGERFATEVHFYVAVFLRRRNNVKQS